MSNLIRTWPALSVRIGRKECDPRGRRSIATPAVDPTSQKGQRSLQKRMIDGWNVVICSLKSLDQPIPTFRKRFILACRTGMTLSASGAPSIVSGAVVVVSPRCATRSELRLALRQSVLPSVENILISPHCSSDVARLRR